MGLFLKQNEQRSQLQSKVAADLAERLKAQSIEPADDSKARPAILDDQRQTSPLAWVWVLVGFVAVVGTIFVLAR